MSSHSHLGVTHKRHSAKKSAILFAGWLAVLALMLLVGVPINFMSLPTLLVAIVALVDRRWIQAGAYFLAALLMIATTAVAYSTVEITFL